MTSSTLLPVAGVKKEETSPCKIISKYQGRRITPTLKRVTLTPRSITIQDDYLRDFQEAMTHQWRRRRQIRTREYQYQQDFLKVVRNSKNHCPSHFKATSKSTPPTWTSRLHNETSHLQTGGQIVEAINRPWVSPSRCWPIQIWVYHQYKRPDPGTLPRVERPTRQRC